VDGITFTERLPARQGQTKIANVVFILTLPPRSGRSSLGIGSTKERFRQWTTSAWADCLSVHRIRRLLEPSFSCLSIRLQVRYAFVPLSNEVAPRTW
jgi:hypothetical protein